MKSAPYLAVLTLLILSSCSSAYKTTQTPDDVYYSPRVQPTYATSNNNASYTETEDGGTYVNYDDDQGDYARRVTLFNDNSYNGGFYDYYGNPGMYSGMYANPYYGSSFGLGFGYGYGYPFYGSRFSLGLGYGWGGYGGVYDPFFSPWYGYGGYGYGYPYYGGYYGGGYYGHNYYSGYNRRAPRNSFGSVSNTNNARVSRSSATGRRVSDDSYYTNGRAVNPNRGAEGGRRVNTSSDSYQPRRSYTPSSGERTTTVDNNGGRTAVGGRTYQPQQQQSTRSYSPPTRTYSQPSQPTRSYSQPSYSPSPSRGGGGGSFGGGGGGGRSSGGRGRN